MAAQGSEGCGQLRYRDTRLAAGGRVARLITARVPPAPPTRISYAAHRRGDVPDAERRVSDAGASSDGCARTCMPIGLAPLPGNGSRLRLPPPFAGLAQPPLVGGFSVSGKQE